MDGVVNDDLQRRIERLFTGPPFSNGEAGMGNGEDSSPSSSHR